MATRACAARRIKHYYVRESVGIAVGFLLAALQVSGLCALTHTPSPMGFLRELLGRPSTSGRSLLIPVGYPAPRTVVPDLERKPLEQIAVVRYPPAGTYAAPARLRRAPPGPPRGGRAGPGTASS